MDLSREGRVLYVSSFDVSIGNGPGVNEREFVVAASDLLGDRIRFLIPRPKEPVPELPLEKCRFSASHRGHHPIAFPAHVASQLRHAFRMLREERYDLLVFRLDVLPLVQLALTRRVDVPYALKTLGQGPIKVFGQKGGSLGRLLEGPNRRMFAEIVRGGVVGDACSVSQVEYVRRLLDLPDDHVVWVDNGVNTRRFRPSPTEEARAAIGLERFDRLVGYVGTRPWERGGLQLVEAAPRLLERHPGLGMLILGGGRELEGLRARAKELGVDSICHFTGYVPFDRVPLYVNSLDVGVSISLKEEREVAAELKVRQYLACGKPVVVSPGANEFVLEHGFGSVVAPRDIAGIADRIDHWLSLAGDERRDFADRAHGFMHERLSMHAMVAQRLELWGQRLDRRVPGAGPAR